MEKNIDLFLEMLNIDSTSSKERTLSEFLKKRLPDGRCRTESFEVGDGTENLLFSWGDKPVRECVLYPIAGGLQGAAGYYMIFLRNLAF